MNTYGYVEGNPLKKIDPLGLESEIACLQQPWCYTEVYNINAAQAAKRLAQITNATIAYGDWEDDEYDPAPSRKKSSKPKSKAGSKPKNCPSGTLPIKGYPGLSHEDIEIIKDGIGNGPQDWTGIDPDGNVITGDGDAISYGPYEDYLN